MKDQLQASIEQLLSEHDYKLFEMKWTRQANNQVLQLVVGKSDYSMDLDGCSFVSDLISNLMDEKFSEYTNYYLEVCSPGAERELNSDQERKNCVGQYVYIRTIHPIEKQIEFQGDVVSSDDSQLVLSYKVKTRVKTVNISYDNIDFMRLAVKF